MKEIESDTGLFLLSCKREVVFQLRTGKGKGMALSKWCLQDNKYSDFKL